MLANGRTRTLKDIKGREYKMRPITDRDAEAFQERFGGELGANLDKVLTLDVFDLLSRIVIGVPNAQYLLANFSFLTLMDAISNAMSDRYPSLPRQRGSWDDILPG